MSTSIRSPRSLNIVKPYGTLRIDYDFVIYDDEDSAIEAVHMTHNGDLARLLDDIDVRISDLIEDALRRHALSSIS